MTALNSIKDNDRHQTEELLEPNSEFRHFFLGNDKRVCVVLRPADLVVRGSPESEGGGKCEVLRRVAVSSAL
jgi:hypothetical protein